jgi:hypothetical protein
MCYKRHTLELISTENIPLPYLFTSVLLQRPKREVDRTMEAVSNSIDNRRNADKVRTLLEVRKNISETLLELRHDLESVRASKKVTVGEILTCAENIQLALKAPPRWKIGLPLYFSHAPTISTEEMRRGKLADYNKRENQTKVTVAEDQAIVENIQKYVHVVAASNTQIKKEASDYDQNGGFTQAEADAEAEAEAVALLVSRKRAREEEEQAVLEVAPIVAMSRRNRHHQTDFMGFDSDEEEGGN